MLADFTLFDGLGVIGSLTICAAYLAVSAGWMTAQRRRYQVMNAAGSIMLLVSLWFRPNPGAIVIEVLWLAIALWSLWRLARGEKRG